MTIPKILIICHEYPPLGGGGGVGAQQYAEAWAEKGHVVTVITSQTNDLPWKDRQNGVEIVRVLTPGIKQRAMTPFLAMVFYCLFSIIHVIRHLHYYQQYHVINTHFALPGGLSALVISRLIDKPNLLTIIGGDIFDPTKSSSPHRSWLLRTLNSYIINKADKVVAISSDTQKRAEMYYRLNRKIEVVNYGFVPAYFDAEFQDVVTDRSKFNLIAVGRLVERKGFRYLIQSLGLLPPDIQLHLIGDGPLEAELKELVQAVGVAERVTFWGYKTRGEVYHYLRQADCFVLSSIHEGMGIVLQEAMDAGLPIVATNNGGQVDLIQEPRNGLLVDIEDPEQLAIAIYKLYSNRELMAEMGQHNKDDVEEYYMINNAQKYLDMFEDLIQRSLPKAENGSSEPDAYLVKQNKHRSENL